MRTAAASLNDSDERPARRTPRLRHAAETHEMFAGHLSFMTIGFEINHKNPVRRRVVSWKFP
jgi:hypothetical protein